MKKPTANTQQEKTEIEQLSQAELVELVVGLAYFMLPTLVDGLNWKQC